MQLLRAADVRGSFLRALSTADLRTACRIRSDVTRSKVSGGGKVSTGDDTLRVGQSVEKTY